jgi:O-acetyl-ADP-ribose deacetylase
VTYPREGHTIHERKHQEDLLRLAGRYLDFAKIVTGTARLYDRAYLEEKLELYRRAAVRPFIGGQFFEYVLANQGWAGVGPFFAEAHALGEVFVENAESLDRALQWCGHGCTNGCMHGAVSKALGHPAPAEIRQLMNICQQTVDAQHKAGNCAHAIGHGLLARTGRTLHSALDSCARLFDEVLEYYCSTGVFMEFWAAAPEDGAPDSDAVSQHLMTCRLTTFPAACYRYLLEKMAHTVSPPEILEECKKIRQDRYPDGLPTGKAVATTGGNLPARWVIHTVGPVYAKSDDRSGLLASCHTESLRVADELGAGTVAFPAISTGVYGYPVDEAAAVAVPAVARATTAVDEVRLGVLDAPAWGGFE